MNGETSLLLLGSEKEKLIQMDLVKGKVVQEYDTNKNTIERITQPFKNAQTEKCDNLLGLNSNGMFKFDLRLHKGVVAEEKVYATDNEFYCMSTTLSGGIAIGSLNGQIRLFTKVGQNAKNLIPGLGDPIKGIDVSLDGKWVVATCNRYLILLPTTVKGFDKTYFEKTEKLDNRNIPHRLFLKSEDISKYKLRTQTFTVARFNSSDKLGDETSIICSIGNYILIWDLKKALEGKSHYCIKSMSGDIVESDPLYKKEHALLVTLPQDLRVQNRKMN
jgi:VID27 C-terminal WD40-like domain